MVLLKKGDRPAYKGDGIAVWINKDKNGNEYLSCKILGSFTVNAFENIDKKDKIEEKEDVNR